MSSLYETRDREIELILSGKSPADGKHDDLYVLAGELQNAFPEEPIPAEVERAHLAAMIEASLLIEGGEPVVVRGTEAHGTAMQKPGLWKKRRKPMSANRVPSLAVKVTSVALGVFAVFGGVAAAGVLPDSLQSTVSRAASHVGLNIPDGSNPSDVPEVTDDVTLPDHAKVPTTVPVAKGSPGAPGVTDDVTLPDQTNVPTTVPVAKGSPGAPGVLDHVTLPDQTNVTTTVPLHKGPPASTPTSIQTPVSAQQRCK